LAGKRSVIAVLRYWPGSRSAHATETFIKEPSYLAALPGGFFVGNGEHHDRQHDQ
jgi:hypothetical protein